MRDKINPRKRTLDQIVSECLDQTEAQPDAGAFLDGDDHVDPEIVVAESGDVTEPQVKRLAREEDSGESTFSALLERHRVASKGCFYLRLWEKRCFWSGIKPSLYIRNVIFNGYSVPFRQFPDQYSIPNNRSAIEHSVFVSEEVGALSEIGSVIKVDKPPFGVNPLTVAVQASGKKRLVLDCSYLNTFLVTYKFKLEQLENILKFVEKDCFMAKLDLKSGYHHVHVSTEHQKYLGFHWNGQYYMYRVLPFGLSTAPFLFTKLLKPLLRKWRSEGILVFCYLDDILVISMSRQLMHESLRVVVNDLDLCGFVLNVDKCTLCATKQLEYLGFVIDSGSATVSISEQKWSGLRKKVGKMLLKWPKLTVRELLSVAGSIVSLRLITGSVAMYYSRALYRASGGCSSLDTAVTVDEEVLCELQFWNGKFTVKPEKLISAVCCELFNICLETDASALGWAGVLKREFEPLVAADNFEHDVVKKSSAFRELLAVFCSLRAFEPFLRNSSVSVKTDNSAVPSIIRKGSMIWELNDLAKQISSWCLSNRVTISVEWFPREQNVDADFYSKYTDWDDWGISVELFEYVNNRWGPFSIDLFANHRNSKCVRFYSRFYVPGTCGVDALKFCWINEKCWSVPPLNLVAPFLFHFEKFGTKSVLIVPHWESAAFWPLLESQRFSRMIQCKETVTNASQYIVRGTQSKFSLDNRNYPLMLSIFVLQNSFV